MAITRGKVLVTFEADPKERDYIHHVARLHGLSMAAYLRMRALSPIEVEE